MKKLYIFIATSICSLALLSFSIEKANAQAITLQSVLNVTNAVSGSGNAGIVYTGTEYWVSKFYTDSIATLSPSGTVTSRFVVPGVAYIRNMTWNGTFIYASVDNNSIKIINPTTKTLVGTITAPVVTRHISYTPTANGGAGGLWIGDDFGDIFLISLTGATLQTIPEATHGLHAMWASGYDSTTTNGGPYLWLYDRGTNGSGANLVRVPISTGVPNYIYDTHNDFPGLAGGAYISFSITPGQKTILALSQAGPDNIGFYKDAVILPVTIISFTGESKAFINNLKWKTATEQNSKSFELQRSADGNHFTTITSIGSKAVNGNSITEISYSLDDAQPLRGDNYYRLKQIDKDGRNTYSSTIILKGKAVVKGEINNVYPNPVTAAINISANMPKDSKISFLITDIKGNLLIRNSVQAKTGNNIFTLKTESLTTGSYILKAIDDDGQAIGETKFIKQ